MADDKNQSPHGPKSLGIGVGGVLTSTYPPQESSVLKGGVIKEKHDDFSVSDCMSKNKDKVDDPGAYCASIQDKISGTTMWRGHLDKEANAASGFPQVER